MYFWLRGWGFRCRKRWAGLCDSLLKLDGESLRLSDYFTPYNAAHLTRMIATRIRRAGAVA